MAQVLQVTLDNLGEGFLIDQGASEIKVNLDVTTVDVYSDEIQGGDNGVNGSAIWEQNSTVTRTAEGQYNVVFDNPHPDGIEYHPSLSGAEDGNRDAPKVWIVQGSKTANGFTVAVTVDDNGTGADPYEDNGWSFSVSTPVTVVTGVTTAALTVVP